MNRRDTEPSARGQRRELAQAAFPPAEVDEHSQIHSGPYRLAIGADLLYHEDGHPRAGGLGTSPQDLARGRVVPVVEDRRENIAAPARGDGSKKLPAATVPRSSRPAPAKALRAVSAVSGSSKTVPRSPGYFFSIAIISAPLPPPTSIRCPRDPQSYASRIAGKSAATSEPICASNEAKREGSAARSSQNDVPNWPRYGR